MVVEPPIQIKTYSGKKYMLLGTLKILAVITTHKYRPLTLKWVMPFR